MPSLNSLGEFISSFADIANERENLKEKNINYDSLPLPGKEAAPMEFTRRAPPPPPMGSYSDDMFDETPQEEDSEGGFDFEKFLGGLPADVNPQDLDEPPSLDDLFNDIDQSASDAGYTNADDEDSGMIQDTSQPLDDFSDSADFQTEDFSADNFAPETPTETSSGDFSMPDGLDSESHDSTDFETPDFGSENFDSADNAAEDAFEDLGGESRDGDFFTEPENQGELPDFNLPETETPADGGDFDLPETETPADGSDFDLPEAETPVDSGDFDLPDFGMSPPEDTALSGSDDLDEGSIDMGGESLESPKAPVSDDFSTPDFGSDFDTAVPDTDFSVPDFGGDFDSGSAGGEDEADSGGDETESTFESGSDGELADFGSDFDTTAPDTDFSVPDFGGDFDSGSAGGEETDLGSDFVSDSIELETDDEESSVMSSGSFGDDDFTIPGLEEIFEKSKTSTAAAAPPKKGFFKKKKTAIKEDFKADDDIEEIRISQEQLDGLLETLAAYPLNLRVACEELIAEKVLLPAQLSKLIHLLVNGGGVRETATFAEELLGKPIVIPRGYEKMTGAAFEAEQASFAYIFMHNFLPVLRLFAVIAALAASVLYLGYKFVYIPLKAESIYRRGYERIPAGEYQRANQLFSEAFTTHPKKKWFYLYAQAFRDQRRYLLAEEKYDDLLRYYPRDKKGVLDYAHLETYYLLNYEKANRLLQQQLLDYAPDDYDGLISAGDNFLLWGDSDPARFYDRYEDARFSYARILDKYGWTAPVIERMMKYFIRTDNLKEVLNTRIWFESDVKRVLSPSALAELGGYLLDKQLEEVKGVPDAYIENIESVRNMLLKAVMAEPELPEPHYHLARYHHNLGNTYDERLTLENAIRAFDLARTETVRRRLYRVDAHYRYANMLINSREFFPAEEQIVRGIQLYEDFLSRNLLPASPQLGRLYAAKGDLEYFVKSGDMNAALNDYRAAERYGYSPPETQYRMGSAYYQLQDWRNALEYFVKASAELPLNRRLLYALGNASYQRGDYFAAQGYYTRLLDILDNQRLRLPVLLPNDSSQFLELGERIMMAMNNAGVVYEMLADQTTNRNFRSTALAYYAESARAWDSITRNPETMIRMQLTGTPGMPGINLGYLNASNAMRPVSNYRPEIFIRIDKDVLEPSRWEELAPGGGLQ